ncbi:aldehyde dehydrogenase [Mesorhizobium sp. M4B.F.Ca.ET.215.01.1.1]|uniref:aldehyde dehydrogenase n=4 Tax=Mesorhizobium TaxID=68287 RepID=UPI000FCA9621|nr:MULTISPECIES: aldehyde dehydrogenase [unclassified Mesorhizobium]TIX19676.1 MAG: aldehyde dehydrogenase family protein [Mesorhizobium sp.]RUW77991.1 aldehyde dehydrogenase [Mesorhizobium sp. M4B.F.Ca.ET.049.02.1.2]TGQ09531.1 aldehyde dehydrogenase [Mesorhizobium sp. M4B.F.Ca.ET.215.01.1.1]TGQ36965.1 aldehyde dehydrogenase [Mesorhizobium sp. M4B.F.Ca.ET.214.01.1.1]TGQ37431.1 aldehyde dehydrogenase [Mesorhizobium sp. M00.F.Ca.ET.220.01.1.1]
MNVHADFHAQAEKLKFETRAFIDGAYVAAKSGETFETVNPATGRLLANVAAGGAADVDLAVRAARRSFEAGSWSGMPPRERKKVLLRFADLIEKHSAELALIETLDCGKPINDSLSVDLPDSVETLRWHAEATDKIYDQMSPAPRDVVSMIVREPIGIVGGVIPWNFPLFVAMWKLAPALAGGNSLVLKPAEQTSLSLIRLAALASEAGIPDGVFNVVPGLGPTAGQAIGLHRDIDCVSFTGSGEVGRLFLKYSADSNMKRIILECGGKSPAIVMSDVKNFAPIVENVATGILFCQGENCSAGSRLIVHESIKDRLLDELKPVFESWTVGDPLERSTRIGAMIEEDHLAKVLSYIETGRNEGAKVALGGNRVLAETGGSFVEPTIFDGVSNTMKIAREEIFGPVLSVISFKDEAEAVRIANDTNYGLAASLYTDDLNTAHRVAKSIRAGTVSVNCYSEGDFAVPFGGYKESGFGGKDKGLAAHDQYTETKAVWIQLR